MEYETPIGILKSLGMEASAVMVIQEKLIVERQLLFRRIRMDDKRLSVKRMGLEKYFYYLDIFLFGVRTEVKKVDGEFNVTSELIEKEPDISNNEIES